MAHTFLEGLLLPGELRKPCNHTQAQGCLEAVLKLDWSSNWQGRLWELVTLSNLRKDVRVGELCQLKQQMLV